MGGGLYFLGPRDPVGSPNCSPPPSRPQAPPGCRRLPATPQHLLQAPHPGPHPSWACTPAAPAARPSPGPALPPAAAGLGPSSLLRWAAPHLFRDQLVLLSGHHRSDSGRSAPPCRGSGEVRRLRRERRRQSCSPPPALLPPRRPQPGPDTSAQRPTRRSAAAAVAVAVGPSPSPRLSMEKWRRPLSREFGPWGCEPGAWRPR